MRHHQEAEQQRAPPHPRHLGRAGGEVDQVPPRPAHPIPVGLPRRAQACHGQLRAQGETAAEGLLSRQVGQWPVSQRVDNRPLAMTDHS